MTTTQNTPPTPVAAPSSAPLEVTIVLPCRNEERTVAACVENASEWLARRGLEGEVVVVDNASADASAKNAAAAGARVIHEPRIGYGVAIRAGIRAARGTVIIMADADNTYDLTDLDEFYDPIGNAHTHDMVIGNRFAHGVEPAAMNSLHRVGNRLLSGITRVLTGTNITDVHCGLRSFSAASLADLPAWSTGMEFATHTITHAQGKNLRIAQVPTSLAPASPGRTSHLRPTRDGLRHLGAIARAGYARASRNTSTSLRMRG